ncbi:MAG: GNAT family N-acetyltransferase [Candidatus Nanopelagicales bacterium]
MYLPHVEILREQDRPALIHMLEDAGDLDPSTIGMYRIRRAMPDVMLVAWVDGNLVGMFNTSCKADFHGMPDFESFDLPPRPHAFMDRIHVHPAVRRGRVGQALVDAFIRTANDHACTFAGGHVDATSDPTGRIEFFERLGFEVHGHPPAFTVGMLL